MMTCAQRCFLLFIIVLITLCACSSPKQNKKIITKEFTINNRELKVRIWRSNQRPSKGVILFSHGAASSPWKYESLISYWHEAGYDIYAPIHIDSTEHPDTESYKGLASWAARLEDFNFLADRYGAGGYVAAGHSYGALLALTKGGASPLRPQGFESLMSDNRVSLVLAFSPPGAIPGFVEYESYSTLNRPVFIQTGTKDVPIGINLDWQVHLDAFNAAGNSGHNYAMVLNDVDHYFGGAIGRPELTSVKQTEELKLAAEFSLLMLESYNEGIKASVDTLKNIKASEKIFSVENK